MSIDTSYPSDLRNHEWQRLHPMLPKSAPRGRPRKVNLRTIINGIRYFLRSGCAWRMLPKDFGPWRTVYGYFAAWTASGWWERIHDRLRAKVRQANGRCPQPTGAVLDSQTVKLADQGGPSGYDAAKKTKGRKRHILVDTLGLLLGVHVAAADEQDRDGAKNLLERVLGWYGRLAILWADSAYAGHLVDWVKSLRPRGRLHLEIVRRDPKVNGFAVLPKRWVVERTFAWLGKYRRLTRDYECKTSHSEALIYIAMSNLMLRRLARSQQN